MVTATTAKTAALPRWGALRGARWLEPKAGGLQGLPRQWGRCLAAGQWRWSSQSVPAVSLVLGGGGGVCRVFSPSPGCFPLCSEAVSPS